MDSNKEVSPSLRSQQDVPLDILALHSTNLLTALDEDGVIQYESPSVECLLGYEQNELVGEQVVEYFHPDDRETVTTAFQAVVASEGDTVETVEYRHKQADGTYLWVESAASGNPTPDGNYVINTRDISDRKQHEQKLERQNERLDEFVGVVSHDLRNPLNIASSGLELIADECESDQIQMVEHAHERMETLIEELLTLAREGEQVSDTEVVDLGDLALDCWQHIETGEATIVADIDVRMQADKSRLQQLLENLMHNAVEHGGGDVTITIGMLDDGFYVEDDGTGIPSDDRSQVFEAGYSEAQGGTGFGLSIVKRVVEAHEWDIRVSDSIDGGARFEITGVTFSH